MNPYWSLIAGFALILAANNWLAKGGMARIRARLDAADAARVEELRQRYLELAPEVGSE